MHIGSSIRAPERGHKLLGGEELTPSSTTRKITRDADGNVLVTDGPYAESVEQLGGVYLVQFDDLDDLLEVCAILQEPVIEVRATVDHSAAAG